MAKISIFTEILGTKLGEGTGRLDKKAWIATIDEWTNRAGLQIGKKYALKIGRVTYARATCSAVANASPFATFINVE